MNTSIIMRSPYVIVFFLKFLDSPKLKNFLEIWALVVKYLQFGEGKRLPTAYAFALVEDRRPDKIRLRMYLSGEVKQLSTEETEACPRLLNMRPLVTENAKLLHVLKVSRPNF